MATNQKKSVTFINILIIILIFGAIAAVSVYFLTSPTKDYLQGQVEATEIHVAPKVTGRLEKKLADEGQSVKKGQLLAILSSPELDAKLIQAQSAKDAATAQYDKAINGTRYEQVQGAYNSWQQAKASADLAETTYKRMENLYQEKVIPAQKRDEAKGQKNASREQEKAAYNNYLMAKNGARTEDKNASAASMRQAEGAVKEVNVYRSEINVIAPADGEVNQYFPNLGELVNAGYPIVNLVDLNDIWVVINIKEDQMGKFKMNSKFEGVVPALDNKKIELQVKFIAPLGDFATWTATKTKGGFDMRTFKIKAYPTKKIDGFRPGMSVLIPSVTL
ncbi:efflux RND transporter periplasmic adaptor subunit [Chryseobacterium sp. WG14]|uniref:HlyD family secretion protein n=1 Tax=unclassified Chryseobacterium TaxID=2593645 RepID=UPI001DD99E08|nr:MULTISPECIES: efflux RND transporter periplasmic adaptor subunit [unclassified Chryseobacterium]MCQ9638331.1 efflux RND transporter periplasmic adaptor subunit [Chryseobacterium sp. WG14]CAH0269338.1 Multidrug resistance protein MdtN [Chryseobacterium sp. Bi04]